MWWSRSLPSTAFPSQIAAPSVHFDPDACEQLHAPTGNLRVHKSPNHVVPVRLRCEECFFSRSSLDTQNGSN